MDRRRAWLTTLAGGLLVLVAVPAGWALSRPPAAVGTDGSEPEAVDSEPDPQRLPVPSPSADVLGTRSARAVDQRPAAVVAPVRLLVPSIGVDAPVAGVGVVAETSEMELPPDIATVGWYRPGVAPGAAAGTVVLAGHVDSRVAGAGVFHSLERAEPGDPVTVLLADGTELRYEVVGRRTYAKAELPTAELFATGGPARLALVTCGGAFDRSAGSYVDNIVVYALPV